MLMATARVARAAECKRNQNIPNPNKIVDPNMNIRSFLAFFRVQAQTTFCGRERKTFPSHVIANLHIEFIWPVRCECRTDFPLNIQ